MLLTTILFALGLALIIQGGGWFVGASVRLAGLLRLPRVVVGTTLVSLATTSPELMVSIMAGLRKESGLAVGNAVGSCVCNICLILGASAAFKHIDVRPSALRRPIVAMFLFGLLLFAMTVDLVLQRWQGILLILLGLGYFAWDFLQHRRDSGAAVPQEQEVRKETSGFVAWLLTPWGTVVQFLGGAVVVIVGSRLLVDAAVAAAGWLGIRPILIGLTVVAVGTSLPELITAFTSSRQNVSDLSVGNILGANIANLSFVVGGAAAINEVRMDHLTQVFNFPALLVSMVLFLYVVLTDNRVTRRQGFLLLAAYAVYLSALAGIAIWGRG